MSTGHAVQLGSKSGVAKGGAGRPGRHLPRGGTSMINTVLDQWLSKFFMPQSHGPQNHVLTTVDGRPQGP